MPFNDFLILNSCSTHSNQPGNKLSEDIMKAYFKHYVYLEPIVTNKNH